MATRKISPKILYFAKLFSDEGLTRKAYLNALSSIIEYGARLLVGFIMIPIIVASLGNFYYGLWQVITRVMAYVSSSSAKPTQALKWSLANQQASDDYEFKRTIVGSTIAVWMIFFPLLAIIGGILSWFLPVWLEVSPNAFWQVRITAGILVLNLIMTNLSALPRSVLLGENLGYKRMGLSALLVLISGGFTWIALYLGTGIVGMAIAVLVSTIMGGIFYIFVVQKYSPWFGVVRPSLERVKKFLSLSGWFLIWDLLYNFMIASDVVVLGFLVSVESVTSYTLTKYVPELLTTIVTVVVFGILPGLGGIIGSGDLKRASRIRNEIMILSWLILTCLGATILFWNRIFLQLWVGNNQYAGMLPTLLIVIFVSQFVFIQNDANIINLSLRIQWKVYIGVVSVGLCLLVSSFLVGKLDFGVVGLLIGFIIGRMVLSIGYPLLVGRFLKITLFSQLKGVIKPILVMSIIFLLAAGFSDYFARSFTLSGLGGWFAFILSAFVTAIIFLFISFYIGLNDHQRRGISNRIRMIIYSSDR